MPFAKHMENFLQNKGIIDNKSEIIIISITSKISRIMEIWRNMHKDNRDYSLDIIRIIACMMVICIHTVVTEFYTPKVQSSTWGILNFYDTISRPGVPLFFHDKRQSNV